MLVLDSGGLSRLATRDRAAAAVLIVLRQRGLWPPVVPTMVLVESLTGRQQDSNVNRFLTLCEIDAAVSERVAFAEPGGHVLTSDPQDLTALAASAADVAVQVV
jgi:hypothetical protein